MVIFTFTMNGDQLATIAELMNEAVRQDNTLQSMRLQTADEMIESLEMENVSLWNALNDESRNCMLLEQELDNARAIIEDLRQQIHWLTHPNPFPQAPLAPPNDLVLFSDSDTESDPSVIDLVSP